MQLNQIKVDSVLSEVSHYTVKDFKNGGETIVLLHHESQTDVTINAGYVRDLLVSADQFDNIVTVGKEDKFWTEKQIYDELARGNNTHKVGELRLKGIRTIWNEIYSSSSF